MAAFDLERFQALRAGQGGTLGTVATHLPVTGSTNDDAKVAARQGAAHGTLFIADQQLRGRGRSGNQWWSEPQESLLFSLVLRPNLSTDSVSALTLAAGLGVIRGAQPYSPQRLMIKWPNDVFVCGSKLAGILVEAEFQTSGLDWLVVGIGLNVLGVPPAALNGLATTLEQLGGGKELTREAILVDVLGGLEHWLARFVALGSSVVADAIRGRDELLGKAIRVGNLQGTASGIDHRGHLRLTTPGGREHTISAGTVESI